MYYLKSGIEFISQIDKTLSEYFLFASVQFSLIFKIGSGKLKGFLHRLIVLQDPVAISWFRFLFMKLVVIKYLELLLLILFNALKISLKDKWTKQSRQNITSDFGRLSIVRSIILKTIFFLLNNSLFLFINWGTISPPI